MLGYLYNNIFKIYLTKQCQAWCYVQSNSLFNSESSSLFILKMSRQDNNLNKNYQQISITKWKLVFILVLSAVVTFFVRSRHHGEADIQDYAPAQKFFCTLLIVIAVRRTLVLTGLVQGIDYGLFFFVKLMNLESVDVLF